MEEWALVLGDRMGCGGEGLSCWEVVQWETNVIRVPGKE